MLVVRNLWKAFHVGRRSEQVLGGVSFQLRRGEVLGVLGHPSTGKSTLLNLIAGIQRPDRGQIRANGSVSWPVGFRGWFAGPLSSEENLRFLASLYGGNSDQVVDYVHSFAEVKNTQLVQPWQACSGDVQNRIAFAASLAFPFDIYLLDGDPAVGAPPFRKKCLRALSERVDGAGMVIVARKPGPLDSLATRYGVLHEGTLKHFRCRKKAMSHFGTEAA